MRPVFVAIGLGANLGTPVATVRLAARGLSRWIEKPRLSPLYRTSPVGGPPQPDFVNAVLAGWTRLAPRTILARLRSLERAAGRRRGRRNGPRTLDLDLLLYGDRLHRTKDLVLPHPRLAGRVFVLTPLSDLAARRVVPGLRKTVARLLREARARSGETVRRLRASRGASASRTSAGTPRG